MIIKEKNYSIDLGKYKGLADREIIRKVLLDIGKQNERVLIVGADAITTYGGDLFKNEFPERSFDFGIAEPNMITAAAGLAKMNKIPVCGIYAFLVTRAAEQIKLDVCYNNNNVKIFCTASGFDLFAGGVTHHGNEDISILRNFPNLVIIQPASPYETILACFKSILEHEGPVYIRLTRYMRKEIYKENNLKFKIGKSITLKEGEDITIIATGGRPVNAALKAAEELANNNINLRVINMHTLKPIDKDAILKASKETKGIITIEEGNIAGGLGAAVNEVICNQRPTYVKMIGIPYDQFTIIGHSPEELCEYFGICPSNIVKKVKQILC